jgi:hypothetical protein
MIRMDDSSFMRGLDVYAKGFGELFHFYKLDYELPAFVGEFENLVAVFYIF